MCIVVFYYVNHMLYWVHYRHKHKESCHDIEGPSISRVLRKFAANKLLTGLLQASLVCYFGLLHNSDPNKIFMARIDVGIKPSDKTIGFKLFSGADVSGDIEGILQLNAITPCDLITKPRIGFTYGVVAGIQEAT